MPSPSVRRVTHASSTAALVILSLTMAGCGSSGEAAIDTPRAAKSSGPAKAALAPAALVKRAVLVNADFSSSIRVKLMPGGDKVAGQITLNNCGDDFSTEAHRVARRQVAVVSAKGEPSGISNEVAVYDRPEQAAKAMTQFRKSIIGCRKNVFVKSKEAGVPDLRYEVNTLAKAKDLPIKDNAVATQTIAVKGMDKRLYAVVIFQRQGTVLSGMYLQSPTKPTADDVASLHKLAETTGKRLASL